MTASPLKEERRELRSFALPVIAIGTIIAILYFGRVLFITSITAVIGAFLLEPFVSILVRLRFPRAVASFAVWVFSLLALYLAGLGAFTQVSGLIGELPVFSQRLGDIVEGARKKIEAVEETAYKMIYRKKQQEAQAAVQAAAAAAEASRH
ncbi:MAG: AI-2E family transporter, partial [Acidobacteriota bacterium]|nr:AI-2E family transporter [Acidobacteriota bacterium]